MKYFLLLLHLVVLSSCQTTADYRAGSVAEARAYARKAVELGVIHKGGEEALIAEKSNGKRFGAPMEPSKDRQLPDPVCDGTSAPRGDQSRRHPVEDQ